MTVTVQLFGAFRPYGERLAFTLNAGARICDLRAAFAAALPPQMQALITLSRFADERTILAENAPLLPDSLLAILPPVSGG